MPTGEHAQPGRIPDCPPPRRFSQTFCPPLPLPLPPFRFPDIMSVDAAAAEAEVAAERAPTAALPDPTSSPAVDLDAALRVADADDSFSAAHYWDAATMAPLNPISAVSHSPT